VGRRRALAGTITVHRARAPDAAAAAAAAAASCCGRRLPQGHPSDDTSLPSLHACDRPTVRANTCTRARDQYGPLIVPPNVGASPVWKQDDRLLAGLVSYIVAGYAVSRMRSPILSGVRHRRPLRQRGHTYARVRAHNGPREDIYPHEQRRCGGSRRRDSAHAAPAAAGRRRGRSGEAADAQRPVKRQQRIGGVGGAPAGVAGWGRPGGRWPCGRWPCGRWPLWQVAFGARARRRSPASRASL
jgi:hypothetical protein